jgi:hypothetical protein
VRVKEGCSGQIALSGVIPKDALENQDEAGRVSRALFLSFDSRHKTAWNNLIPAREPDSATDTYASL